MINRSSGPIVTIYGTDIHTGQPHPILETNIKGTSGPMMGMGGATRVPKSAANRMKEYMSGNFAAPTKSKRTPKTKKVSAE